jgi:hypothetical protein
MPYGVFPVQEVRTILAGPSWGLRTRLRTRLRRNRLDAELAAGATPTGPLGLRAEQLTSQGVREQMAQALADAVADARTGQPATIEHPQRGQIRDCEDELLALAARLRSHQPVDVRGAALVALLVNDRIHRTGAKQLRETVAEAHSALIPELDVAQELSEAA